MEALRSLTLSEFFRMELPQRDHVVRPFLPQKGLIEIYASPGIGKTTFALALAVAASTGNSFQGWEVDRPWRVLYIDGEMECVDMRERINAAAGHIGMKPEQISNFRFLSADLNGGSLPDIGDIFAHYSYEGVFEWAEVIFLDNISSLWLSSKENDADAWSPIRQWLSEIKASGRSVVLIHHANKNGLSRGSSKRHDALDTVIRLERPFKYQQQDGAVFEVHFEKSRGFSGKNAEPVGLKYSMTNQIANWERFIIGQEKYEQIAELSKQGLTQQNIAEQTGLSQGEVSKRLRAATAKGLI
ncbi:AAA family ATPase [Alphaproteobacteria bacterium]|nr:AAA family ATPase [Alphaproteobacteria bacterium]